MKALRLLIHVCTVFALVMAAVTNVGTEMGVLYLIAAFTVMVYAEVDSLASKVIGYINMLGAKEALKTVGISEEALEAGIKASMQGKDVQMQQNNVTGEWRLVVDGKPVAPEVKQKDTDSAA